MASTEHNTISFRIDGEFITNLARQKFYQEHNFSSAIKVLWNCTICDQQTDIDHFLLCISILTGAKQIKGIYPDDDYGVEDVEGKDDNIIIKDFINEIDNIAKEVKTQKEEYDKLLQKYMFVCSNVGEYSMRDIANQYYKEYEEYLFEDHRQNHLDNMLSSYLEHMKNEQNDDYGWLEPNGTFHAVEWGNHSEWASDYCDEHYPYRTHKDMYWKTDANGDRQHYVNGDFLVYVLGWVLLDSPYRGIATATYDPARKLTRAQQEFLYDYYIKRNQHEKANSFYQDEF